MNRELLQEARKKFMRTDRLHRCLMEKRTYSLELRHSQHMLLGYLSSLHVPPTQRMIADEFRISAPAVANAVKRLEADGYVEKHVGNDARSNSILITEKGLTAVRATRSAFEEIDFEMLSGLTDEELSSFCACLDKVHTKLLEMDRKDSEA